MARDHQCFGVPKCRDCLKLFKVLEIDGPAGRGHVLDWIEISEEEAVAITLKGYTESLIGNPVCPNCLAKRGFIKGGY